MSNDPRIGQRPHEDTRDGQQGQDQQPRGETGNNKRGSQRDDPRGHGGGQKEDPRGVGNDTRGGGQNDPSGEAKNDKRGGRNDDPRGEVGNDKRGGGQKDDPRGEAKNDKRGGGQKDENDKRGGRNDDPRGEVGNDKRGGGQKDDPRGGREQVAKGSRQPKRTVHDTGKHVVKKDDRGKVREITSKNGTEVRRDLHDRRVVEKRDNRDGRRVVSMGKHRGFTEHRYSHHDGHDYVRRIYVDGGHSHAYSYRTSMWHGYHYYSYVPVRYYQPVFYGWAYNPWPAPVYYHWGWRADPWSVYYGSYFVPEPVYPVASLWLADYLLAASLRTAYVAQQEAPVVYADDSGDPAQQPYEEEDPAPTASNEPVALSPEVKKAIQAQVEAELRSKQQATSKPAATAAVPAAADTASPPAAAVAAPPGESAPPPVLNPEIVVFLVSEDLVVTTFDGGECELTSGDVLTRDGTEVGEDNTIEVTVTASKRNSCPANSRQRIPVADLQEMHNRFCQQVDAGLETLAAGGEGLPAAPDVSVKVGEVPPPEPDALEAAAREVQQLQYEGEQVEREAEEEVPVP